MTFHLTYRINRLRGELSGDLPTVTQSFTAMIGHRLTLEPDWRSYRPPTVVQLRQMVAESGRDISFDLTYRLG